jgi:hypothetical protein
VIRVRTFAGASPFIVRALSSVPLDHELAVAIDVDVARRVIADPGDEDVPAASDLPHP